MLHFFVGGFITALGMPFGEMGILIALCLTIVLAYIKELCDRPNFEWTEFFMSVFGGMSMLFWFGMWYFI